MACMEHSCVDCDFMAINNSAYEPRVCPKCGGNMNRSYDEVPEREDDREGQDDEGDTE